MGILNRMGAFKKKCITHIIDDGETKHEFKFYPPRYRNISNGQTRELLEPIIQAVTSLMAGGKDTRTQHVLYGEGGQAVESTAVAPDGDTLQALELRRRQAVSDALGIILNENTADQLGRLLADSLRDDFPKPGDDAFDSTVTQFMDDVTTDVFFQFMFGYFKAILPFLDAAGNSTPSDLLEKAKQMLGQGGADEVVARAAEESGVSEEAVTEILQGPTPTEKQNSTEVLTEP